MICTYNEYFPKIVLLCILLDFWEFICIYFGARKATRVELSFHMSSLWIVVQSQQVSPSPYKSPRKRLEVHQKAHILKTQSKKARN